MMDRREKPESRRRREDRDMRAGEDSRSGEKSNSLPYVLIALGLTFVGFGASVALVADILVPFFVFMFPASVLLALGLSKLEQQGRKAVPPRVGKERELLSAIRNNAGGITPAEAAMETSLTVSEADEMLSELAGGGHLLVESSGGTLFYKLPGKRAYELEDRIGADEERS